MTIADTSLLIYRKLEGSGALQGVRLRVFKEAELFKLRHNRFFSSYDIEQIIKPKNYSTVAARFSELVECGLFLYMGIRWIGGKHRKTYDIIGKEYPIPTKPIKRKNKVRKEFLLQMFEDAVISNNFLRSDYRQQILKRMK